MKQHLNIGQKLHIDFVDWEDNYQGFVLFSSIEQHSDKFACKYESCLIQVLDARLPSLLYSSNSMDREDWFVLSSDRTIRLKLREFLGIPDYLVRHELAEQKNGCVCYEMTSLPTFSDFSEMQWQDAFKDELLSSLGPTFDYMPKKAALI